MSIAGIRSNRGDSYQTLVALDWALTVLTDPEFQWIEIDSTLFEVDDVVIGKTGGTLICCQCKKNQPNFKAWSIADLAGELDKAILLLSKNRQAQVRFYSRSEFGSISKLREFCILHESEADYSEKLTKEHTKTNCDLAGLISAQGHSLSTYEFLNRVVFEISPDFDRMETLLHERLRQMASNSDALFQALWLHLDKLGGRMASSGFSAAAQHRLTTNDLKRILGETGAMLVPVVSVEQVRASYSRTSAVGRSWLRDISGQRISSPIVSKLLTAIEDKKTSILLTGLPGSGKTCVMLDLQEALEERAKTRSDLVPLFIQSREFADFNTAQERQAQGLSENWVEQAARLAEGAHVVVVIDSLDVLSIAREHGVLTYFLGQIDQLLLIPNVTVVTACRDFDRKYDRRITARVWDCELRCRPLDWETEVVPLVAALGIDLTAIDSITRELIRNPRELALFVELSQREGNVNVVTSQALAQRYLNTIVRDDDSLGDAAVQAIEAMAAEMLQSRSLSISPQRFSASEDILRRLYSLNVLQDTHDENLTFGHQTLLDVLVISDALRQGLTLNQFIKDLPPVPFVRPSIRSFVTQLAMGERPEYRKQLRAVLTGGAAFHIRRLIAESFAQQVPQDEDWPLIRDLRNNYRDVFQVIYTQATAINWHHFWLANLVPLLKNTRDVEGLTTHVYQTEQWKNEDAEGVLSLWFEALSLDWLDGETIAGRLCFEVSKFETENLALMSPLLEKLLSMPRSEHSYLGHIIRRCVIADVVDDGVLWNYIAGDLTEEDIEGFHFDNKLHCQSHEFEDNDSGFLKQRMLQSTTLLDLALNDIERWSQIKEGKYKRSNIKHQHGYLDETSYADVHSKHDNKHIDSERILFDAIEEAILEHAKNHSHWWQQNRDRLCFNRDGALCYFAVVAFTNCPHTNIELIGRLLCDRKLLEFELQYELGALVRTAFISLDNKTQDTVMAAMLSCWEEMLSDEDYHPWVLKKRAEYISTIPCYLRSTEGRTTIYNYESKWGR